MANKNFYCDEKFNSVLDNLTHRGWIRDLSSSDDASRGSCSLIWTNLVCIDAYSTMLNDEFFLGKY